MRWGVRVIILRGKCVCRERVSVVDIGMFG